MMDLEHFVPGWENSPHDSPVPMVPLTLVSVMVYTLMSVGLVDFLAGGHLALVAIPLLVIPLWEWRKGRIQLATALTCIITGYALAPFLYEWSNYIYD